jgi:peptide/nickel transport system ATP-binding protein
MVTSVRTDTLLEVKNLCVDYLAGNGTVHAVTDVNFTLERGEILGLAGESGCGKSTLAYAISRLLRPPAMITGGEVLYHSRPKDQGQSSRQARPEVIDVLQLSPADLRAFRWSEMSIVFQSAMNALNPVMDIGTQIMDVLKTHRPDMGEDSRKRRAIELLGMVGIAADRLRSYPHELSGGMRQRAAIAIALALTPELIIMDEPTTALDVVVQREILQLISQLCKDLNTALIFITHDLSLLIELADKIAIMYAGRVVEKTSSNEIYRRPSHPYSYGLLNSFPTLHGPRRRMVGIPGSPPDLRTVAEQCAFSARCPFAFSACTTHLPTLQPIDSTQASEHLVACHLHDPRFAPAGPPSHEQLAERYEMLAEGRTAR